MKISRTKCVAPANAVVGLDILVVKSDGNWHEVSGTSFAAPHVTATVALMLAVDSTLTPAEVLAALTHSADKSGNTGSVGYLDAGKAVTLSGSDGA